MDGIDSILDLSSIIAIHDSWDDGTRSPQVHTIQATSGGRIDLSSLATIDGPIRSEDKIQFIAEDGGSISGNAVAVNSGSINLVSSSSKEPGILFNRIEFDDDVRAHMRGSILGNIVNNGELSVADSPDSLLIIGNYLQTPDASLTVSLDGSTAGEAFDQINVSGIATVDGTLNVIRQENFVPSSVGDAFDIVRSETAVEGRFASVSGLELPDDEELSIFYRSDRVVLRGTGSDDDGILTFGLDEAPIDLATGDLDGDGRDDDLLLVDVTPTPDSEALSYSLTILFGDGELGFENSLNIPVNTELTSVAVADLNNDGRSDIVATAPLDESVLVWLSTGPNTFSGSPTSYSVDGAPASIVLTDLNGDERPDVIATNEVDPDNGNVTVLLNDGSGVFPTSTLLNPSGQPIAVAAGDIDGNGLDIAIASEAMDGNGEVTIWSGAIDGSAFTQSTSTLAIGSPGALTLGDIDNDGDADLLAGATSLASDSIFEQDFDVTIFLNDGIGNLAEDQVIHQDGLPTDLALHDMDSDGDLDLISVTDRTAYDVAASGLSVRMNDGGGHFVTNRVVDLDEGPSTFAMANLDNDARLDIVAVNSTASTLTVAPGKAVLSAEVGPKRFTYDPVFSERTSRTDELGRRTLHDIDPQNGNVLSTTRVVGELGGDDDVITQMRYNDRGQLIAETDPLGRVTEYAYDQFGRLEKFTFAVGTDDEAFQTFGYDNAGNRTVFEDENRNRTEFDYDALNREEVFRDALRNERITSYDTGGNAVAITDRRGHTTTMDYDGLDRLIRETNALGFETQFGYDETGNLMTTSDALGRSTTRTYDERNRVVSETDVTGRVRSFEYDIDDNQTAVIDPVTGRTERDFDARSRVSKTVDSLNNTSTSEHDPVDNQVRLLDAKQQPTDYVYDDLDRLVSIIDTQENSISRKYDKASNLISNTDEIRNTARMEYDQRDRRIANVDPLEGRTEFEFDGVGNLLSLTDPVQNTTSYRYDELNREEEMIDPRGQSKFTRYDEVGNVILTTDRNERTIAFNYDEINRLAAEVWRSETSRVDNEARYEYDRVSNVTVMADNQSQLAFTYDVLNRVESVSNERTPDLPVVVLTYGYDIKGNLVSVRDSINGVDSGVTEYEFDDLGRMTQVTQTGNGVSDKRVDFAYNGLSQFESIDRFSDLNGTSTVATTSYVYDILNRLQDLRHRNASAEDISFFTYKYDEHDRITSITDIDGVNDYGYDERDQLTSADKTDPDNPDEFYTHDANGNRATSSSHGAGYETEPGNWLASDGSYMYRYDDEGNTIARIHEASGERRDFAWDQANRLTSITDASADGNQIQTVRYYYDLLGRRIGKDVSSSDAMPPTSSFFIYDGDNVILDFNQSGKVTARYLHGPSIDQTLALELDGDTQWLIADHLNSTRSLVDSAGSELIRWTYDSFGNIAEKTNDSVGSRYLFAGREFDVETGLHYFRARYYDGTNGRFVSEDPIDFRGGDTNIYRYVSGRPIDRTDPHGFGPNAPRVGRGSGEVGQIGGAAVNTLDDFTEGTLGGNRKARSWWERLLIDRFSKKKRLKGVPPANKKPLMSGDFCILCKPKPPELPPNCPSD